MAGFLTLATPAAAQLCAGRTPLNRAPVQLGVAAGWTSGESRLGLSGWLGTDRLFARGSVSFQQIGGRNPTVGWIGGVVGADQPLRLDNRLHACPLAGAAWAVRAIDAEPRLRLSTGIMIGVLATNRTRAAVVPTIGVIVHQDRGTNPSERTFATVSAGVGTVMTNGLTFGPFVTIPVGHPRESPAIAALVTIPLARR